MGDACFAPYVEDAESNPDPMWYPASITAILDDVVDVVFEGYGNTERVKLLDLDSPVDYGVVISGSDPDPEPDDDDVSRKRSGGRLRANTGSIMIKPTRTRRKDHRDSIPSSTSDNYNEVVLMKSAFGNVSDDSDATDYEDDPVRPAAKPTLAAPPPVPPLASDESTDREYEYEEDTEAIPLADALGEDPNVEDEYDLPDATQAKAYSADIGDAPDLEESYDVVEKPYVNVPLLLLTVPRIVHLAPLTSLRRSDIVDSGRASCLCSAAAPPPVVSRRAVPPPPSDRGAEDDGPPPLPPVRPSQDSDDVPPRPPVRPSHDTNDYNGTTVVEEPNGGEDEYEMPAPLSSTSTANGGPDYTGSTLATADIEDDYAMPKIPSKEGGAAVSTAAVDPSLGEDPDSDDAYEVPAMARQRFVGASVAATPVDDVQPPLRPPRASAENDDLGTVPDLDDDYEVPSIVIRKANQEANQETSSPIAREESEEAVTHTPEMLYINVLDVEEPTSNYRDRAQTIEHRDRVFGKVNLTRIDEPTAERVLRGCDESSPGCHLFRVTPDQGIVLSLLQSDQTVAHIHVTQGIEDGAPVISLGAASKHRFQSLEDLRHFYKSAGMTTSRAAGLEARVGKEINPSRVREKAPSVLF